MDSVRIVSAWNVCQRLWICSVFIVSYWIHYPRIAEWHLLRRLWQWLRSRFSDCDLHHMPRGLLPRCQYTDVMQSLRSRLLCQRHGLVFVFCMRCGEVCVNESRDDLHCVCCGYIHIVYSLNAMHALLCTLRLTHRWIVLVFKLRSGHATQLLVDMFRVLSVNV